MKPQILPQAGATRSAALPVTFADELHQIANQRGAHVDQQGLVRDAVRRHAAAGLITMTDVLLIQDLGQRFFAETMARGKIINLEEHRVDDVPEEQWPFPAVQLVSLIKQGERFVLPPLKVGPPQQGRVQDLRLLDVLKKDRYGQKTFEVDAATGAFKKALPPELAVLLLRNHGASVRLPRFSRRWIGDPRDPGGREVRVDEWILAEKAWLDLHPEILQEAAAPVVAPVIFCP